MDVADEHEQRLLIGVVIERRCHFHATTIPCHVASFHSLHVQHQTQQTSPRAQLQGAATWQIQWHDSTAIAVYMLTVS